MEESRISCGASTGTKSIPQTLARSSSMDSCTHFWVFMISVEFPVKKVICQLIPQRECLMISSILCICSRRNQQSSSALVEGTRFTINVIAALWHGQWVDLWSTAYRPKICTQFGQVVLNFSHYYDYCCNLHSLHNFALYWSRARFSILKFWNRKWSKWLIYLNFRRRLNFIQKITL